MQWCGRSQPEPVCEKSPEPEAEEEPENIKALSPSTPLEENQRRLYVNKKGAESDEIVWQVEKGYRHVETDLLTYVVQGKGGTLNQAEYLTAGAQVNIDKKTYDKQNREAMGKAGLSVSVAGVVDTEFGAEAGGKHANSAEGGQQVQITTDVDIVKLQYKGTDQSSYVQGTIIFTIKPVVSPEQSQEQPQPQTASLPSCCNRSTVHEGVETVGTTAVKVQDPLLKRKLDDKDLKLDAEQSLHCLVECIELGKVTVDLVKGKDIVAFIGNTSAGKSTIINYLIGCQMEITTKRAVGIAGGGHIVRVANGLEGTKIGHSNKSETFTPTLVDVPDDIRAKVSFIDFAGFMDNRGAEVNVANAVVTRHTMIAANSVRFMVLLSYYELSVNRAKSLTDLMKMLIALFGTAKDLVERSKAVSVVITRAPTHDQETGEVIGLPTVLEFFDDLSHLDTDTQNVISSLRDNVRLYHPLDKGDSTWDTRKDLFNRIDQMEKIQDADSCIKTVLIPEDKMFLQETVGAFSERIVKEMRNKDYPASARLYKNLKIFDCINNASIERVLSAVTHAIEAEVRRMHDSATEHIMKGELVDAQFVIHNGLHVIQDCFPSVEGLDEYISKSSAFLARSTSEKKEMERLKKHMEENKEATEEQLRQMEALSKAKAAQVDQVQTELQEQLQKLKEKEQAAKEEAQEFMKRCKEERDRLVAEANDEHRRMSEEAIEAMKKAMEAEKERAAKIERDNMERIREEQKKASDLLKEMEAKKKEAETEAARQMKEMEAKRQAADAALMEAKKAAAEAALSAMNKEIEVKEKAAQAEENAQEARKALTREMEAREAAAKAVLMEAREAAAKAKEDAALAEAEKRTAKAREEMEKAKEAAAKAKEAAAQAEADAKQKAEEAAKAAKADMEAKEKAAEAAKVVRTGARVYIKLADHDLWLCDQPHGTYCATVGRTKVPFYVFHERFGGRPFIRLQYDGADRNQYLQENKFLYAAATSSTKYDTLAADTTQMWVRNPSCGTDFKYGETTALMDRQSFSCMAANLSTSAESYKNGSGKHWVEAKYNRNLGTRQAGWIFERADCGSQPDAGSTCADV